MRRPSGGYTLIEVLMFLAVSSVLLAMSAVIIRGQSASTEFTTGMNDVDAKMQQWLNEVVNGFSNNASSDAAAVNNYKCEPAADGYPQLTVASDGNVRGANPNCIFMGKVLQVNDDPDNAEANSHIYAYTVLGRRTYMASGSTTIVDKLSNAKPVIAIFPAASNPVDLTEYYKIPNGVRVLSVKTGGSPSCTANCSHLAGFFTSLGGGGQQGIASLMGVQYPLVTNFDAAHSNVKDCVKMTINPCLAGASAAANPWPMQEWQLCFASTRNDDRGLLTISSNNGTGVSTTLRTGPNLCT